MRIHPFQVLSGISFVVFFESRYFETWTSLYLDTFCLLYLCVCVCMVFQKAGEGVISQLLLCFPLNRFPLCRLCVCGKVCGRFRGTVPTLRSAPSPSIPSLFSISIFSLIYPSILFRPSVAAAPLSLSITPAVMRLNLSVSTGHAHARIHTPFRALQHTHTQSST